MNGSSPTTATPDGKIEAAPEWSHQHESISGVTGVGQKLKTEASLGHPAARTMTPHRKAKRKVDGPLEIFCGFVVEHQIGISKSPKIASNS
jgi:very-long-chain ceramide synthase